MKQNVVGTANATSKSARAEAEKEGRLRAGFSFKQQVMLDFVCHWSRTHASRLIGVETPALPLVFLNYFSDIFVVTNLHAFPFFQPNFTFRSNFRISFFITVCMKCIEKGGRLSHPHKNSYFFVNSIMAFISVITVSLPFSYGMISCTSQ